MPKTTLRLASNPTPAGWNQRPDLSKCSPLNAQTADNGIIGLKTLGETTQW